jgi:integrase
MARSTIDRRENGRYRARYVGPDKRWKSKTFDRKIDAERWLRHQLSTVDRGEWIDPALRRTQFGELADRWLSTIVGLRPKTRANYESLLACHVLPQFGEHELAHINRVAAREWLAGLQAAGLSASRTRQARQVLSSILELAVDGGYLLANPARGLKVQGGQEREMLHLDAAEVRDLIDAVEQLRPSSGLLVQILAYGGLRWGEAVAIRRGRGDLLRSKLMIRESLSEVRGHLYFGPTKTHEDRVIVLPKFLRDGLAAHLAQYTAPEPDALVFTSPKGEPLRISNWRRRVWRPACEASGMPDGLRIHDLRHTAASLLVSAGANVKVVQRHLGHSTATQTLDRYAHLFTEDLEAVAERLNQVWAAGNESFPRAPREVRVVHLDRAGASGGGRT